MTNCKMCLFLGQRYQKAFIANIRKLSHKTQSLLLFTVNSYNEKSNNFKLILRVGKSYIFCNLVIQARNKIKRLEVPYKIFQV